MMQLDAPLWEQISAHAAEEARGGIECCGLLTRSGGTLAYAPCRNLWRRPGHFVMDPQGYADAEAAGEVVAVVHSHVGLPPTPSQADRVACNAGGLPWLIVNWPLKTHQWVQPDGYEPPYLEREFTYGVLDCYTLAVDYYRRELGIAMPDRAALGDEIEWWKKGKNLYVENFPKHGFVRVDSLQPHDLILMTLRSDVPNHLGVYLRGNWFMHHVQGQLSCKAVYGGFWEKNTTHLWRHRSLT